MQTDAYFFSIILIFTASVLFFSKLNNSNRRNHLIFAGVIFVESVRILFFFNKIHFIFPVFLILLTFFYFSRNKVIKETYLPAPLDSDFHFLSSYYHAVSLLILLLLFILEITLFDNNLTANGYLLIIFSIILLLSSNIPRSYHNEYNFLFLFVFFIILFMVVPDVSYKFYSSSFGVNSTGWIDNIQLVHYSLALPLSNLLNFLGFTTAVENDLIFYEDLKSSKFTGLKIAQSCSGIESIVIFISAFFSYAILDRKNFGNSIVPLAFIGIMVAYIANILRMAIIVITGHYYGHDALLWVHTNVGWIIFIIWVSLFWYLVERFVLVKT